MKDPHIVCVLQGSGTPIFSVNSFDYKLTEGDLFKHTVEGVSTTYKVESAILDINEMSSDTANWTRFILRITASIPP